MITNKEALRGAPLLVLAVLADIVGMVLSAILTPDVSPLILIPWVAITLALLEFGLRGARWPVYVLGAIYVLSAIGQAASRDAARVPVVVLELLAVGLIAAHLMALRSSPKDSEGIEA